MLVYRNPKFDDIDTDNSIFSFRRKDWERIPNDLREFFTKVSEICGFEFKKFEKTRIYGYSRKEINDTELDYKIIAEFERKNINSNNDDITIRYDIVVPKMSNDKFLINGVKRFLTFQLVDMAMARKQNQIRINSCIRNLIVNIDEKYFNKKKRLKEQYSYYMVFSKKKKIPLALIILTKYNFKEIKEKFNVDINFKDDVSTIELLGDLLDIDTSRANDNFKHIFEDLNYVPLKFDFFEKVDNNSIWCDLVYELCGIDISELFHQIYELDIYLKRYMRTDNIIDEIIYGIDYPPEDGLNLNNKRLRISEYIISYIINNIYSEMVLNYNKIKRPIKRNYNIHELLPGKFQELFQMSKVEDNLVGEIMEMCKVTISGPGGIPINSVNIDNKNIHDSFYGIIDPIFTPDGDKCGVINYLVITAQINDDGTFIRN